MKRQSILVLAMVLILIFSHSIYAGTIESWGHDDNCQVSNTPTGNNFVSVTGGGNHNVAIKSDGSLAAWGDDFWDLSIVPTGNDFVEVAAGNWHSLALKADGSLVAWGRNNLGQCDVPTGNDFIAIADGPMAYHGLALRADGSLAAWGYNSDGQSTVPTGNDFVDIAVGGFHSIAIKDDGSLEAWGKNQYGQCDVPSGNDFIAIAAGSYHNLALKVDGSIVGWGENNWGALNIPTGNDFVDIAAGNGLSLALRADGSLVAWGWNAYGQTDVPAGNNFISIASGSCHGLALTTIPYNATVITYTGDLSEQYSDQAGLSATLVDEDSGAGISGQTIVFTIGSQSVAATTSADGSCSASLTMNQVPGSYIVTASYAGNANYQPSSDAGPFEVLKEDTILTYTGDLSEPMLYPADLSANLLDADTGLVVGDVDRGIEGCTINFSIGSQFVVATTLTDGSCSASLIVDQELGLYTVTASYSGNANYEPSSDSDTFQITNPLIITPSEYDFGNVVIGTSSTFVVSILGNGVTPNISSISIIGSPDFSITTMPSLPVTVPLDLEIAFAPMLEGYDSAGLRISATSSHTASTITYDVLLDGVGVYTEALIDILDDNITPKTKWIKCQIWPPDGYRYADIDIESILLDWGIPVSSYSFNERKQILVLQFPASGLNLEPSPDPLELTVIGELIDGSVFEGSDFVTVISKGGKKN